MEFIRGIHNLAPRHRGCVATIGNFDGVHRGHQAIISQLRGTAAELSLPLMVILFEPQPREFFYPDKAPQRLMTLREKLEVLEQEGVDRVLCVTFNETFCSLSAQEFCDRLLRDGLDVRYLVVGDDFRFGHDRAGDFRFLMDYGKRYGFEVENIQTFEVEGARVSSTRVRSALMDAHFNEAGELLGRPYYLSGRVVHGDKLGRQLGIPTANLLLKGRKSPLSGVYAALIQGVEDKPVTAVVNIGSRPTVGGVEDRLEAHVLNYDGDLYGRRLKILPRAKIREEIKFKGVEQLKARIAQDIHEVEDFFTIKN